MLFVINNSNTAPLQLALHNIFLVFNIY